MIPAKLRQELGIEAGQTLLARAVDGRLVLEPRETVLARLRARFTSVPADVSMVDQLIAERGADAARDGG